MIQTLTDPGTETDTVTSVSSGMGTFQFVNSYNDGADTEIWVCPDTTGAADTVTVNTPTNAWDALAVEFNAPATGLRKRWWPGRESAPISATRAGPSHPERLEMSPL